MTLPTRTLKDYRPQHDHGCAYWVCGVCGKNSTDCYYFQEHPKRESDRIKKHAYVTQSCSCGLDHLLAEFDAPGAQERKEEKDNQSRSDQPQLRAGEADPRGDDRAITLPHLETPGCHETVGGMCHHFVLSPDTCDCGVVERNEANR